MGSTMWTICFVILCVAFLQCEAAVWQGSGNNTDNDGCIVGSKKYAVGEYWFEPGRCARFKCKSNSGAYSGNSCGVVLGPKECRVSEIDNTKIYPECCPRVICPGDSGF